MTPDEHAETIQTHAEHHEQSALPCREEVHTDPNAAPSADLPDTLRQSAKTKSPAQWAYERIILYIQNFEKMLDSDHEVGMGFVGGDAGTIKIEGLGFYDPDLITFYGTNGAGARTQLIQHVSQLNVQLVASPKHIDQPEATRIGFHLAKALEPDDGATP